ncbi:MAG: aminoacyl-histidine dipeptidase [Bacteroidales bacterium]|nr:aminoacyl-histidine dipeptidase [Bacteroidales bacterium]MDY6443837.1 aminoacyl-histidine dipeptidase [Bacteroidales bacterium]
MTIKDLKPQVVWNNFYGLTRCPRPSKHEEIVRQHLLDWAKEHKVEAFADETGNVIMRIPATPGYENRKGVVLQGHMDMVPQKTADTVHDFLKDPINTVIDGEWVTAVGTTLGADNGMGVAMAMSVAEDKSIKHGPIEVLVTYDEETGMTGAEALKPGLLKGDILLNLDSEDENELCIGCAGGLDAEADFKYKSLPVPAGYVGYKIELKGLSGGHSGMDISLYRGNANKIMVRTLIPMLERYGAKVADFNGGSLRNAIPFEADAVIALPKEKATAALRYANEILKICRERFKESDPGFQWSITRVNKPARCIEDAVILNACKAIAVCPSNVIRMSQTMQGLTETSINLAVVRCKRGHLTVNSLLRSAMNTAKQDLALRVKYIFEFAGAKIKFFGGYPGWTPKPDTPINKLINDMHVKLYGKPMNVLATHGGLECALLGAKYPNWEMVSIGPTVLYPHSPDERVNIASVQRSWDLLKAVLENIPEK